MAFVLDASVTVAWAFQDESHPEAGMALSRMHTDEALAPALWWFEVRNTLIVGERRKRITESETTRFLDRLGRLAIRIEGLSDEAAVLRLARKHRLSVYDAAYLELAQREGLMMATLDSDLAAAARSEKVKLIGQR